LRDICASFSQRASRATSATEIVASSATKQLCSKQRSPLFIGPLVTTRRQFGVECRLVLHLCLDRRDYERCPTAKQKITFAEMRDMGVRGVLLYCADYRCSVIATSLKFIGSTLPRQPCETLFDDLYFPLDLLDR
jgi:hypothetical protein